MNSNREAIRLDTCPFEIFEELANAASFELAAKSRAIRYSRQVEPAALLLAEQHQISLPTAGLNLDPSRICGLHARNGRIEMDFCPTNHRLDLTPQPDLLQDLILSHTVGITPSSKLQSARRSARRQFTPCHCCRDAAEKRRAHPERHPLFRIIHEIPVLHFRITSPSFSISHHAIPQELSVGEGKISISSEDGSLIKIDAGYIHCLFIQPVITDGESRPTIKVFDMLGEEMISISTNEMGDLHRWQQICTPD